MSLGGPPPGVQPRGIRASWQRPPRRRSSRLHSTTAGLQCRPDPGCRETGEWLFRDCHQTFATTNESHGHRLRLENEPTVLLIDLERRPRAQIESIAECLRNN